MEFRLRLFKFMLKCFLLLIFVLEVSASVRGMLGQVISQKLKEDDAIKLGTTLVQVPVIVSDLGRRYITDLEASDFSIYEDGVKQQISFFGSVEEPFSAALLLDSSGSTQAQLAIIKEAALAFIESLRPQDRVMIIVFNDSVEVLCELTNDKELLRKAVGSIRKGEFTQVYEAVYTAVWEKLHDVAGRKALILFTDGIDTASSEISEEDTLDALVESEDIIVYPVRFSTRADVEQKLQSRVYPAQQGSVGISNKSNDYILELDRTYRQADEYLYELAELSGGIVERVDAITDLKLAFSKIASELRQQYLLGYYPSNRNRENYVRKINIKIHRTNVRVRFRPGYRNSDQQ